VGVLRWLINLNVALSRRFDSQNLSEYGAQVEYLRIVTLLFSVPDVGSVLDVAAGGHWHFPSYYKTAYGLHVTGIDIDEENLKVNRDLDGFVVGDVCSGGLLGPGNYDLLTCYSGIEHFPDVESFLGSAFASLRGGGALVAQFPSSLAPFAILNRLLPQELKRYLIRKLSPAKTDEIGYPAVYDRCKYSSFKASAERCGFEVEYYLPTYMSSSYFYPFFPAIIASQALDYLRLIFGTRNMASYNLFLLRRSGKHFQMKWSWHPL